MTTIWNEDLTRRTVLRLGLSTAALLALPGRFGRVARAAGAAPHFLVTFNVKPDRSGVEGHTQMTIFNSDILAARIVWGVWAINGDWIWYDNAETEIGNSCVVGGRTTIEGRVRIGNGCRIMSHCYICSRTTIGDYVFVGPGCTFLNERYPMRHEKGQLGPTIEVEAVDRLDQAHGCDLDQVVVLLSAAGIAPGE